MNKAITDGLLLMPPAFAAGLDVWSSGDGTPGSDTYEGAANAAFVPADQDFGGCLELQKTAATQKLRSMAETPLLPGCYLQIKARIKALIDAENPKKILSDDTIVAMLKDEGIDLARRTVAKYREAMHIGSSVQRRKEKKHLL